jgi:hypothetical protein
MAREIARRVHRDHRGQMALTMILVLLIVFMFFAVTFDAGVWYFDHRTAQNQTDAAAQAGVLELPDNDTGPATDIALEWLVRNREDGGSNCTADNGGTLDRGVELWDDDGNGDYDHIRVCVSRDSQGVFGLLSDIHFATISGHATAAVRLIPQPYTLMAMNETACSSLDVGGQGLTSLDEGYSYTRSDCDTALTVRGNGHLTGGGHDVLGCWDELGNNSELEPDGSCGAGYIEDPLRDLIPPPTTPCPPGNPATITNPPVLLHEYCAPVVISQGNYTMNGIYVFHRGFAIQGQTVSVVGTEGSTLIYMTCPTHPCNGAVPGGFLVNGGSNSNIVFYGHDDYEDVFLWVDRTAGSEPDGQERVRFEGQKLPEVNGIVYAYRSDVRVAGQNEPVFGLNMAIIGDEINIEGQGNLTFTYELLVEDAIRVYGLVN